MTQSFPITHSRSAIASALADYAPAVHGIPRTYEAGEVLFKEGEAPSGCHLVRSGTVGLTITAGKAPLIIDSVGPGGLVGISALLGKEYGLTATALTRVSATFVTSRELRRWFRRHPQLRSLILTALSENVRHLMQRSAALKSRWKTPPA